MTGNNFIGWALRSPFHRILSNGMMLITVTGRRTGRKYTLPVGYYDGHGSLWILTSRDRIWWRNLKGGAEVALLLKRNLINAFAELELDERAVEERMLEYIEQVPQAAKPLGVRIENGNANADDIARTARERLFVRVKPVST